MLAKDIREKLSATDIKKYDSIETWLNMFSQTYLSADVQTIPTVDLGQEYLQLFLTLLDDLFISKNTSLNGKPEGWAAGIASIVLLNNHDIGFDISTQMLLDAFSISDSTLYKRVKDIKQILNLDSDDSIQRYSLTSLPFSKEDDEVMSAIEKMIADGILDEGVFSDTDNTNNDFWDVSHTHPSKKVSFSNKMNNALIDADALELSGAVPEEVINMLKSLQDAMDELSMRKENIDEEDIHKVVQDLGLTVMTPSEFAALQKESKALPLVEASDLPIDTKEKKEAKIIQGVTITAMRVPVNAMPNKNGKKGSLIQRLQDMEPASTMIH